MTQMVAIDEARPNAGAELVGVGGSGALVRPVVVDLTTGVNAAAVTHTRIAVRLNL